MLRFAIILAVASYALATKLHVVHEWKYLDYLWDSKEQNGKAIDGIQYNRTNIFTIDIHKVKDGRMFVTTPAFYADSVPATLSTVSRKKGPGGPLLKPYPDWCWHNSKNCKGMTSVWRITVDECNRLWVLDSGKIADKHVCPAQLFVFDLRTDKLIKRIKIPDDVARSPRNKTVGRLTYPVVETEGTKCERTWAYMVDFDGGGLVIYNGSNIWRLNDDVFHDYPAVANYSIAGVNFSTANGLFGLALTPGISPDSRRLYFRPIGSVKQYSVSVGDLHRSASANQCICYNTSKFCLPSPVIGQSVSRDAIMFFGLTKQLAIACWNVNTPMDEEHVVTVAQDDETLQYASGIKITSCPRDPFKETLWVSTNRLQKALSSGRNFSEINYRIARASVDSLVKGTKCQLQKDKHTRPRYSRMG